MQAEKNIKRKGFLIEKSINKTVNFIKLNNLISHQKVNSIKY